MSDLKTLAIVAIAALLLGLAGGGAAAWFWQANAYEKELAMQASAHQSDLSGITNASAAQVRTALEQQQTAEQAAADSDAKHTKERADDLAENERLRRAVADGPHRLRVAGTCTATATGSGDLPKATGTAGVGDAGTVELAPTAGRNVFDIREGIVKDQSALRALQDYVRTACGASAVVDQVAPK